MFRISNVVFDMEIDEGENESQGRPWYLWASLHGSLHSARWMLHGKLLNEKVLCWSDMVR